MLSVTDFYPKGTISEVRVHAGAKFGHTGCWSIAKCNDMIGETGMVDNFDVSLSSSFIRKKRPLSPNAVRDHARTAQVDFEVDRPPPADSAPGDLLTTMVKETVILYKKEFRRMKKSVPLIDLKVMKTRNDFEIACDCVKQANVVLHVGLCKEI